MSGSFMGVPFTTNQKAFIVTTCIGGFSYFGFRLQQWLLSKYGQDIEVRAAPCPARAASHLRARRVRAQRELELKRAAQIMRRNEILAINGEEHAWRIEGASKGGPSGPPPEPSR